MEVAGRECVVMGFVVMVLKEVRKEGKIEGERVGFDKIGQQIAGDEV